jgi:hypothetical protein
MGKPSHKYSRSLKAEIQTQLTARQKFSTSWFPPIIFEIFYCRSLESVDFYLHAHYTYTA